MHLLEKWKTVTASVPERSKGLVLSSNVFALVGSNPTACKCNITNKYFDTNALVAQLVERGSYEPKVASSSLAKSIGWRLAESPLRRMIPLIWVKWGTAPLAQFGRA